MPHTVSDVRTFVADHGGVRGLTRLGYGYVKRAAGLFVVFLIAMDAVINNWTLGNYLGGGYFFLTPIGAVQNAPQLETQYSYMRGHSITNMSNMGQWMANYTIVNFVSKNERVYAVSAGEFDLTPSTVLCPIFQGDYHVDLSVSTKVKLAVAVDSTTFFRGNAFTHASNGDGNVQAGASSVDLFRRGYLPGRTTVDKRFTHEIVLVDTPAVQKQVVSYFRIYSHNYCTGCDAVAELGYSTCELSMVYTDATKTLTVTTSAFVPGSTYKLGFTIINSAIALTSLIIKLIAIFVGFGGYIASRRTVQWFEVDPAKPDSFLAKVIRTVVPKYFPFPSEALSYDMMLFNSDVFVYLYTLSVVLDLQNCLQYVRDVSVYNSPAPQALVSIEIFSLSFRLLWLNLVILKLCKLLWNLLGIASYNGQSVMMGFFNFSSVTTLYLSGLFLFYIPSFIDYNNSDNYELYHQVEPLDGIRVEVINGIYARVAPYVITVLLINILVAIVYDHVWNLSHWKMLRKNSLARQAVYNSTSVMCDFLWGIEPHELPNGPGSVVYISARRLSTLQWFYMSHLTCFGLPAKDLVVKKRSMLTVHVKSPRNKPPVASAMSTRSAKEPSGGEAITTKAIAEDDTEEFFMLAQDGDANIHILDGNLTEVPSVVYNVKILKNNIIKLK
ncbi:hypothetical protein SDRG_12632 [Saprolegnia diclina VS20]|uniref:Uncharacterized protein n=1 Tax=Saprolegnia diclina (strain VS20) TaxID=1156394 RepID=T0RBQ8_SAPDV|nr:hypothetical protein SDRG_12632 [Saprolegnia diclina VS20]EQC29628.1 hypothetical protein SDRG_12632 [Saprolegnia diclina VS20]|eukprot:XP_008616932.1 hypothetical protein SDRG_12632 [Saprolegnia diclina VS20]